MKVDQPSAPRPQLVYSSTTRRTFLETFTVPKSPSPHPPLSQMPSHTDQWGRFLVTSIGAATLLAVFSVCLLAVRAAVPLITDGFRSFSTEALDAPLIASLIQIAVLALLFTVLLLPFGIATAIYLHEYSGPKPWSRFLSLTIRIVAGTPSILLGILALIVFSRSTGSTFAQVLFAKDTGMTTVPPHAVLFGIAGALALLALPAAIVAGERAMASVPETLREGSYACGASDGQTLRQIVLPYAWSGILAGALLSLSRGLGEVTPFLLVAALRAGLL